MDFGVFVCSTCSGIHREINHKVKGIGMCNFNDKEIEILTKNGNEVIYTISDFIISIECLKNLNGKLQFEALPGARQTRQCENEGVFQPEIQAETVRLE
jgi:hypothetical protein